MFPISNIVAVSLTEFRSLFDVVSKRMRRKKIKSCYAVYVSVYHTVPKLETSCKSYCLFRSARPDVAMAAFTLTIAIWSGSEANQDTKYPVQNDLRFSLRDRYINSNCGIIFCFQTSPPFFASAWLQSKVVFGSWLVLNIFFKLITYVW